ncbi:acetyl-coenzyme A carboxylase carboxyl transferase subunit alpha [Clostridiales bacterium]|nr:acetyl-coenzyme A carboxylase carboxyl transferase subunit alpha [Clostridiales bacterium]
MKPDAQNLLDLGVIEKIIPEPEDFSADAENKCFFSSLEKELTGEIQRLQNIPSDALLANRYEKFRKVGAYDRNHH